MYSLTPVIVVNKENQKEEHWWIERSIYSKLFFLNSTYLPIFTFKLPYIPLNSQEHCQPSLRTSVKGGQSLFSGSYISIARSEMALILPVKSLALALPGTVTDFESPSCGIVMTPYCDSCCGVTHWQLSWLIWWSSCLSAFKAPWIMVRCPLFGLSWRPP